MTDIRTLRKGDNLDDLIALSRDFFEEYEVHHEDFFKIDRLCENDIVDFFSRSIDSDDGTTFIAIENGRTVGYITISVRTRPSFYKIKRVGAISGLMIRKGYRRRGIATQLLKQAMAFFKNRSANYFTVYTAIDNEIAMKFYEKNVMIPFLSNMIGQANTTSETP